MADFNAKITEMDGYFVSEDSVDGYFTTSNLVQIFFRDPNPAIIPQGMGQGAIFYYKMRAFKNPLGTGFVSWLVVNNPDPLGLEAPSAIVPGTAVIMASWLG